MSEATTSGTGSLPASQSRTSLGHTPSLWASRTCPQAMRSNSRLSCAGVNVPSDSWRTVPRDELRLARGRVLPGHLSGQPLSRMARALRLTPGQLLTEVDRKRWTRDYSLPRHLGRFRQKQGAGGGQASGKTVPRRASITLVTSRHASVSCLKMSRPASTGVGRLGLISVRFDRFSNSPLNRMGFRRWLVLSADTE